jgi:hypothetical protein
MAPTISEGEKEIHYWEQTKAGWIFWDWFSPLTYSLRSKP